MAIRSLPKSEWRLYFDVYSSDMKEADHDARVRVLSLEDGDQPLTDGAALLGLTYDPKDDLLEVQIEGLDHLVAHPSEIFVDERDGALAKLEVVRADGTREVIEWTSSLPAGRSATA